MELTRRSMEFHGTLLIFSRSWWRFHGTLKVPWNFMMTSSNGNIFRITGHLCGEFTGPRWIPHTKASDAELWCFLWSVPDKRLSKQSWGWWFETQSGSLWRHSNVITTPNSMKFHGIPWNPHTQKKKFNGIPWNLWPEVMLIYRQLYSVAFTWEQLYRKCSRYMFFI